MIDSIEKALSLRLVAADVAGDFRRTGGSWRSQKLSKVRVRQAVLEGDHQWPTLKT